MFGFYYNEGKLREKSRMINFNFCSACVATPIKNNSERPLKQSRLSGMPAYDTVSFKAITPELIRLLKGNLTDGAELRNKIKRGIIPQTDDNIQALAKEWHKRRKPSEKKHIAEPMGEFWGINVEEVEIN